MREKRRNLRRAALVAAMLAAAALVSVSYRYPHPFRQPPVAQTVPTPQPGHGADTSVAASAPPGTEVVPPEESEANQGLEANRPTESFGRAAGLHNGPDPLRINASAAIVIDHDTGEVLARKNDEAVLPIASLTKLMTTLLVFEASQPMDEVLTITEDDVDHLRHSRSRLRVGTQLTREEALHLALMSSENRAAHALARYYPGGIPKLVADMNAKARALGMKNTTYVEPTGLSNENRSTARDLAILAAAAAQNPLMRDYSTTPEHLANLGGRFLQYNNSDRLVKNARWEIELQKTGYIVEAGRCLTLVTRVAGHELILVLLDSDSNGTRVADAERLRHLVVAQAGWQDTPPLVAAASVNAEPPHHVAGHRGTHAAHRHVEVASKATGKHRHEAVAGKAAERKDEASAVASAKPEAHHRAHEQVAAVHGSTHRVRRTFAGKQTATHS